MDSNPNNNQPNQSSGAVPPIPQKGPLDSNQAAELIRQQLNAIYTAQDGSPDSSDPMAHQFNPYKPAEEQSNRQQAPATTQAQAPQAQQPVNPSPYYNPYHHQQESAQAAPHQPVPPMPGGAEYRHNYSTFSIPNEDHAPQPEPVQTQHHTPQNQTAAHDPSKHVITGSVNEPGATSIADLKQNVVNRVKKTSKSKKHSRLKPLLVAFAIGFVFLAINYNQVAIAQVKQYISPGTAISTPVILDPSGSEKVGKEPKIIIPKINVEAPLIYGIKGFNEADIQAALQDGVVHYGNTAKPGEKGNAVYLGHSSNNGFNRGEYKYVFVLLFRLELDDTFVIHHEGTRYVYKVTNKQVISPTDFSLIQPTNKPTVTLITCTPPGTSWKRLVIQAEQISPDPTEAKKSTASGSLEGAEIVPSDAPSLWSEIWDSIF